MSFDELYEGFSGNRVIFGRRNAIIGGTFITIFLLLLGFSAGSYYENKFMNKSFVQDFESVKSLMLTTINLCESDGLIAGFFVQQNELGGQQIYPRCVKEQKSTENIIQTKIFGDS